MLSFIILSLCFTHTLSFKPCCFKNQWTTEIIQEGGELINGQPEIVDRSMTVHYDFDKKMMHIKTEDKGEDLDIYRNYNTKKEYSFINNTCTTVELTDEMQSPCIPDNATFLSYQKAGSMHHYMDLVTWQIGTGAEFTRITVTENDCTPVVQTELHTTGLFPSQIITLFANVEFGIKNASVLNAPQSCSS